MATDPATREAVLEILEEFRSAVAARDVERLLDVYAPGGDVVGIGTAADEWYVGRESMREGFERDFADDAPFVVDFAPPIISSAGDVAWLAAGFNGRMPTSEGVVRLHGRFTAVLRREDGRWRIVQAHTSLPASRPEAESFE